MQYYLNHNGQDLRDITGTVEKEGPDGQKYEIDAKLAKVIEGQFVLPVNWPTVAWQAFRRVDSSKPTVVIDAGPGNVVGDFVAQNLTNAHGQSAVAVVAATSKEGEALLGSGSLDEVRAQLVNPKVVTDPQYRPLVKQVSGKEPLIDGEYTGPHAYLAQMVLADPKQRRRVYRSLRARLESQGRRRSELSFRVPRASWL